MALSVSSSIYSGGERSHGWHWHLRRVPALAAVVLVEGGSQRVQMSINRNDWQMGHRYATEPRTNSQIRLAVIRVRR
jgi:hypothetical protein